MYEGEEWRAVVGFEGLYEISDHGRVRGLTRNGPKGRHIQGRLLKQSITQGYPFVGLRDSNGKFHAPRIHALVARAFLGERPKGKVTNHIDHNKRNNHISNLEYITNRENIQHAARAGRMGILTPDEVQAIRSLVSRDPATNLCALAEKLDVSIYVIRSVLEMTAYFNIPNKDGSTPTQILSTYNKPLTVEDVEDLSTLGFTIPEIGHYYQVDYSTPYQMLRRSGIWQETGLRGSGRLSSKQKVRQVQN